MVGHDVVQLPGDAGAFSDTSGLRHMAAALRLGGPGQPKPDPDSPGEGQHQIERDESGDSLGRAEPVECDRQQHVRCGPDNRDGAPVPFQMSARAQQRDGQGNARDRVIAQ